MIRPSPIKPGDTIGIVAPSDAVDILNVRRDVRILKKWGFKVKFGAHVAAKIEDFFAGTAEERMSDLKDMINDPEVKAIWAIDGGYAASEILPMFGRDIIRLIKRKPILFIGYSDICMILNALTSAGIVSLMGPNVWGLSEWDDESTSYLRRMIQGEKITGIPPTAHWEAMIPGSVDGTLIVSNLDSLICSLGTWFDPLMAVEGDVILGLEDWNIQKSLLQRQMDSILNHRQAKKIKGFLIGRLTNIVEESYEEWGRHHTAKSIIADRVKKFNVPLAFCADFGHPEWEDPRTSALKKRLCNRRFFTIPNGVRGRLTVEPGNCSLTYLESILAEDGSSAETPPTSETQSTNDASEHKELQSTRSIIEKMHDHKDALESPLVNTHRDFEIQNPLLD
jgi:muramoyltetrapeptide carboxypeptidase